MSSSLETTKRVSLPSFEEMLLGGAGREKPEEQEEEREENNADNGKRVSLPSFEKMMSNVAAPEPPLPEYDEDEAAGEGGEELSAEAKMEAAEQARHLLEQREKQKLKNECENMRREALAEAESIKAEALAEAKKLKAGAEKKAADEIEGRYLQEVKLLRDTVKSAAEGLKNEKEQLFSKLEGNLLDVCVQIAESIVHYELDKGDAAYRSIINNAIDTLHGDETMVLHMPPISYERLFGGRDNELGAQLAERQVKVVKDIDVAEGDCLVSSERGGVRVGAQTQTARLREAVLQKWGEVKK